ncbi:tolB protein precursor protein [Enhygromyxa salina]|uniref:TolB protein protein n=1 Tax=Enhygromyxa salina TaxID=215803 RepID=A0A0C2DDU5_9BACT|nr:tolB protein precursor protein [Enhygromyxa salina]
MLALIGCGPDAIIDPANVEIAFVRTHYDGELQQQLRGFTPGSRDVALLPPEPVGAQIGGLCWSPNGRLLAYWRRLDDDDLEQIQLFDPEVGEARALTQGASPAWSPVGLELGFLRRQADGNELRIIDVETQAERRVGTGHVTSFSWAPDGARLVVAGLWPEHDSNSALYVVDAQTGEAVRIDPDPPNASSLPSDTGPKWSPDGSTIAFISAGRSAEDVYSAIYRVDPNGANFREASSPAYGVRSIEWSPLGGRFAYSYWHFDAVSPSDYGVGLSSGRGFEGAKWVAWSPDANALAVVQNTRGELGEFTRLRVELIDGPPSPGPESGDPAWSDTDPAWRRLPSASP